MYFKFLNGLTKEWCNPNKIYELYIYLKENSHACWFDVIFVFLEFLEPKTIACLDCSKCRFPLQSQFIINSIINIIF